MRILLIGRDSALIVEGDSRYVSNLSSRGQTLERINRIGEEALA
jgi:hypothetical protein